MARWWSRIVTEVIAFTITIKNAQCFCRPSVGSEGMRCHGGEGGCLSGLDSYDAGAEVDDNCPRQNSEPVAARMDTEIVGREFSSLLRDPHFGDNDASGIVVATEEPGCQTPLFVMFWADDDI